MKVFVKNHNISVLKILLSAEFCDLKIEVIHTDSSGDKNNFPGFEPLFESENGVQLFSSNAVCRYLFVKNGQKVNPITDAWLQWESTVFQACVADYLDSSKWPKLTAELKHWLSYIDAVISKQNYLESSNSVGLADIVAWLCLSPVLCTDASLKEVECFKKVHEWFQRLKSEKSISSILEKIPKAGAQSSKKKDIETRSSLYFPKTFCVESLASFFPIELPGFESLQLPETTDMETKQDHVYTSSEIESVYLIWQMGQDALHSERNREPLKLPKEGEKNILITSALPYVNNVPHLGNIIGAVLSADVFARYCRSRNYNTLYVCGTDEYGTATETKAIELGVSPKEICDKYHALHREIYEWFNISFDYFGRTTTEQQTKIAQDIFMKLYDHNLLLEETVEQLFCEKCTRFLADRFVEGICPLCLYEEARGDQCDKCGKLINAPDLKQPQCKVCKSTPHLRSSKHLFLDLPKIEPELRTYLDKITQRGLLSNTAKAITYSWLTDGLKPRCITRDLKWGTPVPLEGFTDKVFYVWYDAPIGYLSITANYTDQWEQWWKQPDLVKLHQFMAKDNVPFHAIIFPACQLGTKDNYVKVSILNATEYLNYEDVKFSKSRGIGVFGDDAKNTGIPADIWRFYLLYIRPENQDTSFSWNDLMLKNNSELLNNLGNFINRALMFIHNNFGGEMPEMTLQSDEKYLLVQITREITDYVECMEKTQFRDAIKVVLNISRIGNQYIQSHKPWELIKGSESERAVAGTVMGVSSNIACLLCTLMEPFMPDTSAALKLQLNTYPECHVAVSNFACYLPVGHKMGKPAPLFRKIEQGLIDSLKEKYAGRQSPAKETEPKKEQLKKQSPAGDNMQVNGIQVEEIEKQVAEQGNKVRQLKESKANKAEISAAVSVLLELKRTLALAKGESVDQNPKGKKSKK